MLEIELPQLTRIEEQLARLESLIQGRYNEEVLTVEEVAKLKRISKQTVLKLLHEGEIKGKKYGREWRVKRKDLE